MLELPPPEVERRPVTLAARLLQGGPVALVTTADRGNANVLPVAWMMPLSTRPPLVAIAIEQSRHSAEMISHSEQFALNFPGRTLLHHVQYLASLSGKDIDKFEATQLETFVAAHLSAPLLRDCLAWVECEVQKVLPFGDHFLYVGLVVAVHVDPQAFDEQWLLESDDARPLHFLGGNRYSTLDGLLEARLPRASEAPERVLSERVQEELELTREARERREELIDEVLRDVDAGKVVDLGRLTASGLVIPTPNPPDAS
ncbi:MAG: flavin reductase family protein [Dehalococcoidia bacterium]|nr:flavin reductase family protein [Dehalococcoidia bacterium]